DHSNQRRRTRWYVSRQVTWETLLPAQQLEDLIPAGKDFPIPFGPQLGGVGEENVVGIDHSLVLGQHFSQRLYVANIRWARTCGTALELAGLVSAVAGIAEHSLVLDRAERIHRAADCRQATGCESGGSVGILVLLNLVGLLNVERATVILE